MPNLIGNVTADDDTMPPLEGEDGDKDYAYCDSLPARTNNVFSGQYPDYDMKPPDYDPPSVRYTGRLPVGKFTAESNINISGEADVSAPRQMLFSFITADNNGGTSILFGMDIASLVVSIKELLEGGVPFPYQRLPPNDSSVMAGRYSPSLYDYVMGEDGTTVSRRPGAALRFWSQQLSTCRYAQSRMRIESCITHLENHIPYGQMKVEGMFKAPPGSALTYYLKMRFDDGLRPDCYFVFCVPLLDVLHAARTYYPAYSPRNVEELFNISVHLEIINH